MLGFGAVVWALTTMVGWRQGGANRVRFLGASALAALSVAGVVLAAGSISTGPVLAYLFFVALVGAAAAWLALEHMPVRTVWERARNLESARSAFLEVDFHRMMIDIRTAGEGKSAGITRLPSSRWLSFWRFAAPLRHAMPWPALRIGLSLAAALLLVAFAPLDQGVVLAAMGVVGGLMQARLGSPDTAAFVAKYDLQNASAMLWARAAAAPLMVLAVVIAVLHGLLEPLEVTLNPERTLDLSRPAQVLLPILFAGSLAVCLIPLKGLAR